MRTAGIFTLFESSVISYGSKTQNTPQTLTIKFESSVISYGSKTKKSTISSALWFESSGLEI